MAKLRPAAKGFFIGLTIVPAMGILAHGVRMAGEDRLGDDYSLCHRFESAYCFNVPQEHREYTVFPISNGYQIEEPKKDRYMANPWLIWPLTLAGGVLGAASALDKEKRKVEYYRNPYGPNGR